VSVITFDLQALVFTVVLVGVFGSVWGIAGLGSAYGEIGEGGVEASDAQDVPTSPLSEARDMLDARSRSRVRRGKQPLDVNLEIALLISPGPETQGPDPLGGDPGR
jgi:hypothetical protein